MDFLFPIICGSENIVSVSLCNRVTSSVVNVDLTPPKGKNIKKFLLQNREVRHLFLGSRPSYYSLASNSLCTSGLTHVVEGMVENPLIATLDISTLPARLRLLASNRVDTDMMTPVARLVEKCPSLAGLHIGTPFSDF